MTYLVIQAWYSKWVFENNRVFENIYFKYLKTSIWKRVFENRVFEKSMFFENEYLIYHIFEYFETDYKNIIFENNRFWKCIFENKYLNIILLIFWKHIIFLPLMIIIWKYMLSCWIFEFCNINYFENESLNYCDIKYLNYSIL